MLQNLFANTSQFLSSTIAGWLSTGDLLGTSGIRTLFHHLQERSYGWGKPLLESMLSRGHQVLQSPGLPWIILLIPLILLVLFVIKSWRKQDTLKKTLSRANRNGDQNLEMLQAEESNVQQLEGEINQLKQDQINLRNEKLHLEQQMKIVKEELEAKNTEYASQISVKEMEEKNMISNLKLELDIFKKQEEEHLMSAHIAEEALAAERKENADLRQKITELNAELAEKMYPVLELPLPQDCMACEALREALEDKHNNDKYLEEEIVQLKDKNEVMEHDLAVLNGENASLLNNCEILLGNFEATQELCEEKDRAVQQLEAEVEQHVEQIKQMRSAASEEVMSQKIQEITEKYEKSQRAVQTQLDIYKKQEEEHLMSAQIAEEALAAERIENADLWQKITWLNTKLAEKMCPVLEPPLPQDCMASEALREALEDKQNNEKYLEGEIVQLKVKIQMMKLDLAIVMEENESLSDDCEILRGNVEATQELCEEKDRAVQQLQAEVEQHVEQIKQMRSAASEEVMSQKIQEITEKYEKTHRAVQTQMSAQIAEEALAAERKENADLRQKITELNAELAEKMYPVLEQPLPQDCMACEALREALEDKQNNEKYLEEEIVQLKVKIEMMKRDLAIVMEENERLSDHCEILLGNFEATQDLCEEKDRAVQQLQAEVEQHVVQIKQMRSAASEEVMSQKIQEITEKYEKSQRDVKTQLDIYKKQEEEHLMSAHIAEEALAAERKENADLRQKITELNAELAEKMYPVLELPLPQDCMACEALREALEDKQNNEKYLEEEIVQLKDKIEVMEHDLGTLNDENASLLNNCEILLGNVEATQELCEEKNRAVQQLQAEVEQHVEQIKQMRSAASEEVMSQKIQEITEKDEKTQRDVKTQKKAQENEAFARACVLKKKEVTFLNKRPFDVRAKVQGSKEPGGKVSSSPFCLEKRLQGKNDVVQKKTTNITRMENKSRRVDLSHQPERVRLKVELDAEKNKVKKLTDKIQAMEDNHKELKSKILKLKIQDDCAQQKLHKMAEQLLQKDQALLQKAALVDSERRDKELKVKDVLKAHKLKIQSLEAQYQASELSYKAEIASLQKMRDKLLKRCKAVEGEQNHYLQKLQLEAEMFQNLTEKIQSLEQDRDALKTEKLQLTVQVSALRSELSTITEMCQPSDQAPHQSTLPVEVVQVNHGEMQALTLRTGVSEDASENSQSCFKAQEKASEQGLEEWRRRVVAPILLLSEVNSELVEFSQCAFSSRSSCSDEELPDLSDTEDVPDLSQMEILFPGYYTPTCSNITLFDRRSRSLPDLRDALSSQNHPEFSMASEGRLMPKRSTSDPELLRESKICCASATTAAQDIC